MDYSFADWRWVINSKSAQLIFQWTFIATLWPTECQGAGRVQKSIMTIDLHIYFFDFLSKGCQLTSFPVVIIIIALVIIHSCRIIHYWKTFNQLWNSYHHLLGLELGQQDIEYKSQHLFVPKFLLIQLRILFNAFLTFWWRRVEVKSMVAISLYVRHRRVLPSASAELTESKDIPSSATSCGGRISG